ncbi:Cytochrome P450 [Mycena sanguinolenta]|uniref:Cytochrome P450 n=1 Tax=Mycena sanguinolenta TaxID=230812 RepID=A0A8H6Z5M7_9AGAR|nr:Cytochrome P450 [Mycena sanguinolenta]
MEFTLAVAIFLILICALHWNRNRSRLPLPPGPRKLPLIGNLFDMPTGRQWETFLKWSKQFKSDIIHLNVAGTSIVVLSSMDAVKELFEKRSTLYSDRPRLPMLGELMGLDFAIPLMKYGDRWRSHRKMFHEVFNVGAVEQFQPQELAATHELLRRLLRGSNDVMKDFRHLAGTVIMNITYGIDMHGADDKYIRIAKEVVESSSIASMPGAFLVDSIPALKYVPNWFPGADFKRKAKEWKKIGQDLLQLPFIETKQNIAMGAARTSFTSMNLDLLEDSTGIELEEQEAAIKATAASMYVAGADTTVSAMGTFILAMLLNPEVQKKAQAEIDSVVGPGQLPGFADKPTLPYVSAIVKEVLRWRNVTPIAIPHYLAVDDEYQGYRIPANSIVIGNAWAILHDETIYPDPHSFKPERFLLSDGKLNPAIRDPESVAFGFGRRICPGRHMAAASLWIVVASILSTFNIDKAIEENGEVIEPTHEYSPGIISTPLPFKCSITPRSPQAVEVIQATA